MRRIPLTRQLLPRGGVAAKTMSRDTGMTCKLLGGIVQVWTSAGIERRSACRSGRRNVPLMRLSGLVSHRRQEDVHGQR